jgi:hypothetical protein
MSLHFDDILYPYVWDDHSNDVADEFIRPRRRSLTNPCVECGGAKGNTFCEDCGGTGEID